MGSKIILELKRLRKLERGAIDKHPADYTIALVYPNSYFVGMSSLGFQLVYRLLNSLPGIRCERGFLLGEGEILTIESLKPLRSFDCVAFSLSYELDYFNVAEVLRRAGIPALSNGRDDRFPLVVGGGVCAWLNPEPLADIVDLFAVGEAEAILPGLCAALVRESGKSREYLLDCLAAVPGVYIPRLFVPRYSGSGRLRSVDRVRGGVPTPARRGVEDLDPWPASAAVVTPETDFGNRVMVEMMRGCGRQCRFCVADYGYRAPRLRSRKAIFEAVAEGMSRAKGIALLGPSPTDHPDLDDICEEIVRRGGVLSLSSVRVEGISDRLLETVVRGGLRSFTCAPETPSEHLRRRLNKGIGRGDVLRSAERAADVGIREVKLYYLLGIQGERASDLEAIAEEVSAVAALIPVRVSAGPLVPKPRTPLQWLGMESEAGLRRKWGKLRKMVERVPRARMSPVSIRGAVAEAALARGDRRLSGYIIDGKIPRRAREIHAFRERDADEVFPWEHLDAGIDRRYLWEEYGRFRTGETRAPCRPDSCRDCGVCK